MREPRKKYEVWGFLGNTNDPLFASDDPVEVVHWIRKHPAGDRDFNVHPTDGQGREFHRDKRIAFEFVSKHRLAAADDIVKKAFEAGKPEGLAKELDDLFSGR